MFAPRYVRKFEDQGGFTAGHAWLKASVNSVSFRPLEQIVLVEPLVECLPSSVDTALRAAVGDQTSAALENSQSEP